MKKLMLMLIVGMIPFILEMKAFNNTESPSSSMLITPTPIQENQQTITNDILEYMEIDLDCVPSCWSFIPHHNKMDEVYDWFLSKFSAHNSQRDVSIANNFVGVNISGFELIAFSSELEGEIYLDSMYLSFPHNEDVLNDLTISPDELVYDELSPNRISVAYTDYSSSNIKNSYYLLVEFSDPNFAILYWGNMMSDNREKRICISQSLESILWFVFPETDESSYLLLRQLADYENSRSLRFPLNNLPDDHMDFEDSISIDMIYKNLAENNCITINDLAPEKPAAN